MVVALQDRGAGRPLFLLPPLGGGAAAYTGLARALGDGRPVFALESPGLHGEEPPDTIEGIAARCLRAVRSVQAEGPYLLAGWSMGGAVAFEMARQMHARGMEVALLALLDAAGLVAGTAPLTGAREAEARGAEARGAEARGAEARGAEARGAEARRRGAQAEAREALARDLRTDPEALAPVVRAFLEGTPGRRVDRVLDALARLEIVEDGEAPWLRSRVATFAANLGAMRGFEAGWYPGRVVSIEVETPRAEASPAPAADVLGAASAPWPAADVERLAVAGGHHTMLQDPVVRDVARHVRRCLEAVEGVRA